MTRNGRRHCQGTKKIIALGALTLASLAATATAPADNDSDLGPGVNAANNWDFSAAAVCFQELAVVPVGGAWNGNTLNHCVKGNVQTVEGVAGQLGGSLPLHPWPAPSPFAPADSAPHRKAPGGAARSRGDLDRPAWALVPTLLAVVVRPPLTAVPSLRESTPVQRILVVGVTGAGKSTLARTLGTRLGLPYHEMDALYFEGPGWAVNADFTNEVARLTAQPRWVVDSLGYPEVRDLLWERADTVIWLDYPRRVVMPRVLRRSLGRSVTRELLFGGNRETWRGWLSREHPVWWSWSQHGPRRLEIGRRVGDARFAPLETRRFARPDDTTAWLATL